MYIPSLLVTHNGEALDDKTIFRKTERIMKATATRLLQRLGKNPQDILLNLGLEQEFFVVPKAAYLQRPDLLFTGRTLVGKVGAKHQQFSDHYFGKFPCNIEEIFCEV
jgi:glutamine synthetase